jgi:radical SAM superfamily enzyme YgiQ (UPF0313 family)
MADLLSDGGFEPLQPDHLRRLMDEFQPDCVGLSLRNLENDYSDNGGLADIARTVADLRLLWPGPIFLGGAGFSLMPEEIMAQSGADYGLSGDAETALPGFLRLLAEGRAAPGLQPRPESAAVFSRPAPDPVLIRRYAARGGLIGVQTKRGCAFDCLYCSYPLLEGREIRFRPVTEVLEELGQLSEILENPCVAFVDAVFNDPKGRWRELLAALAEARLPLRWTAFFQPVAFEPGDLDLIRLSGAAGLEFGTDAASDSTMAGLGKPFDFETVRKVQAECAAAKIPAAHYVVFGGPGETEATVTEGLKNLDRLENCVIFISAGWSVYPRTRLFDLALAEGLVNGPGDARLPITYYAPRLSPADLHDRLGRAFRNRRDRLYPVDRAWENAQALRQMGVSGLLWDTLIGAGRRGSRRAHA